MVQEFSMHRFYVISAFIFVMFLFAGQLFAQADIWIQGCPGDTGSEPNSACPNTPWTSVDIWNRLNADDDYDPYPFIDASGPGWNPVHQNPEHRPFHLSSPNYLYVRVRNRGNQPTTGTERLRVYWTKAHAGGGWPNAWVDNMQDLCTPGTNQLYGIEITKTRKNAAAATQAERDAFIQALLGLNDVGYASGVSYWDMLDLLHQMSLGAPEHQNDAFLPWHRELVNRFELGLREVNPLVRLLYWDAYEDPNPLQANNGNFNFFTSQFLGAPSGPIGAPFAGDLYGGGGPYRFCGNLDTCWQNPVQDVQRFVGAAGNIGFGSSFSSRPYTLANGTGLMQPTDYATHGLWVEGDAAWGPHNALHGFLGGQWPAANLLSTERAVEDPAFFVGVHTQIDKLWAMWQRDKLQLTSSVQQQIERIDPATAYGSVGSDPLMTETLSPWDGEASNGTPTSVSPWDIQPIAKTPRAASILYPPLYEGYGPADSVFLTVPQLAAGESVIIEIPWYPPNPQSFTGGDPDCPPDPGHICLLARLEETDTAPFGMTVPEGSWVGGNAIQNNNVAWRNMTVENFSGTSGIVHRIIISNPTERRGPFQFGFVPENLVRSADEAINIFAFGHAELDLGEELFNRWVEGGRIGLVGAAGGRTVFEDDFNRENGILEGWTHFQGAPRDDRWQIMRNELRGVGATGRIETFTFAPVALPQEFELNFDMRFLRRPADAVGRHGGIMFCAQNRTGRYDNVAYTLDWIDRNDDHGLRLIQVNGNAQRVIGTGGSELRDPPLHWRVVVDADSIEVYGDGEEVLIQSDNAELRGGNLGFWMYTNGQEMTVDNLQIFGSILAPRATGVTVNPDKPFTLDFDCPDNGDPDDTIFGAWVDVEPCDPWPCGTPMIGLELDPLEQRMVGVSFHLDEDYLDRWGRQARAILAARPIEYSFIAATGGPEGQVIGGNTYIADLRKISLIPEASDWRYISLPEAPEGWANLGFDVSEWQTTNFRNRLEHGRGLHDSIHCLVGGTMCSARSSNDPIFFTHHFNLAEGDINVIQNLWLRLKVDDGADIYLNGERVHHSELRPVTGLAERTFTPVDISENRNLLRAGENVVAVVVYKHPEGNDHIIFDFCLAGNQLSPDEPTVIAIHEPADGAYFELGDAISISAEAIDPDGENPSINYQVNGQPIRLVAGQRPSFTPAAPGVYKLRAGCSNNPAAHAVTINVIDNIRPETNLSLPGGMMYDEGEAVIVRATVEDADRAGSKVVFQARRANSFFAYNHAQDQFPVGRALFEEELPALDPAGGTLVLRDVQAPFEAAFDNLGVGEWMITAVTLDGRGAIKRSGGMVHAHVHEVVQQDGNQKPGDYNQDGGVDLSDAISIFGFLFLGAAGPECPAGLDFNGDSQLDLSDGIGVLNWLFQGGPGHALGADCVEMEGCQSVCN